MEQIIVSLTSYPGRIKDVHKVIKTLLIQNKRADKIILWLADSQFPKKEKELPSELLKLCEFGLEIRWCEDLKPHKKYFYAMQEFKDDIIITVDDDIYYSPKMIESLYNSYLKFPKAVSCLCANKIKINKDKKFDYSDCEMNYKECVGHPVSDLIAVGCGGVLYPPSCMPEELFDIDAITSTCLYQDDLWLKAMELKANILTVVCEDKTFSLDIIDELQEDGLCNTVNIDGNNDAIKKISERLCGDENRDYFISKIIETDQTVDMVLKERRQEIYNAEERFKELLQNRKLAVFGAGEGAKEIYRCLHNKERGVDCFLVSSKENNPSMFFDIAVRSIYEVGEEKESYVVIISTVDKKRGKIKELLREQGFTHVYYIADQMVGTVLRSRVIIKDFEKDFYRYLMKEVDVE